MNIRDFLEDYRGIVKVVVTAFMAIILFFMCLGFSRSLKSANSSEDNSGTVLSQESQEDQGIVIELPEGNSASQGDAAQTSEAPAEETTPAPTEPETFDVNGITFTKVNEPVVTTARVNARTSPDTSDEENIIVTMPLSTQVTRTGISTNGYWSQIIYNGETAYCSSDYVSKTNE